MATLSSLCVNIGYCLLGYSTFKVIQSSKTKPDLLLKWVFVYACFNMQTTWDYLLSWLPGYYLGKIFVFIFIFLDKKVAKYTIKALHHRISRIEVAIDDAILMVKRPFIWVSIGLLRIHLQVVLILLANSPPEQVSVFEELCKKCVSETKPEFKIPLSYNELLKLPMTPRTHTRMANADNGGSKYLVRMNIRSATADETHLRFFPYHIWINEQDFFWQAEGDNLVQSDKVVRILSKDEGELSMRLKLAGSVKVVKCRSENCFRELLDKLK
mmetsp:Transcript_27309/g.49108  ORF Transcript_27309/g.49108 Transcript_27309/m.49108 type:complete len:270 (+) Transcript_27309:170-979(+)